MDAEDINAGGKRASVNNLSGIPLVDDRFNV